MPPQLATLLIQLYFESETLLSRRNTDTETDSGDDEVPDRLRPA